MTPPSPPGPSGRIPSEYQGSETCCHPAGLISSPHSGAPRLLSKDFSAPAVLFEIGGTCAVEGLAQTLSLLLSSVKPDRLLSCLPLAYFSVEKTSTLSELPPISVHFSSVCVRKSFLLTYRTPTSSASVPEHKVIFLFPLCLSVLCSSPRDSLTQTPK